MFGKKKPPKTKHIQSVIPYYLEYDGNKGYAQVTGRVEKKFVAVVVNNPDSKTGKINRIMEVTKRKFFSDFSSACTGLNIKATGFILNN